MNQRKRNVSKLFILLIFAFTAANCGIDSIRVIYSPDAVNDAVAVDYQLDGAVHPGVNNSGVAEILRGYDVFYTFTAEETDAEQSPAVLTYSNIKTAYDSNVLPITGTNGKKYFRLFTSDILATPIVALDPFYTIATVPRRIDDFNLIIEKISNDFSFYETEIGSTVPVINTNKTLYRYITRNTGGAKEKVAFSSLTMTDEDIKDLYDANNAISTFYVHFYFITWGIDSTKPSRIYSEDSLKLSPFILAF